MTLVMEQQEKDQQEGAPQQDSDEKKYKNKNKVLKSLLREKILEGEVIQNQIVAANKIIEKLEATIKQGQQKADGLNAVIAKHIDTVAARDAIIEEMRLEAQRQAEALKAAVAQTAKARKANQNLDREKSELVEKFIDVSNELDQTQGQLTSLDSELREMQEVKRGLEMKCSQLSHFVKNDMAGKSQRMCELEDQLAEQVKKTNAALQTIESMKITAEKTSSESRAFQHKEEELLKQIEGLKERLEQHQRRAAFAHDQALRGGGGGSGSQDNSQAGSTDRSTLLKEVAALEARLDDQVIAKNAAAERDSKARWELNQVKAELEETKAKAESAKRTQQDAGATVQKVRDEFTQQIEALNSQLGTLRRSNQKLVQELADSKEACGGETLKVEHLRKEKLQLDAQVRQASQGNLEALQLVTEEKQQLLKQRQSLESELGGLREANTVQKSTIGGHTTQAKGFEAKLAQQQQEIQGWMTKHSESLEKAAAVEAKFLNLQQQMEQGGGIAQGLKDELSTIREELSMSRASARQLTQLNEDLSKQLAEARALTEEMRTKADQAQAASERHEKTLEDLHFTNKNLYQSLAATKALSTQVQASKEKLIQEKKVLEQKLKETEDELVEAHEQVQRSEQAVFKMCKLEHELRSRLSTFESRSQEPSHSQEPSFVPSGQHVQGQGGADDQTYAEVMERRTTMDTVKPSEKVIYEGYMAKQPFGFSFSSSFRERLFVLRPQRLDFYHVHGDGSRALRGTIPLTGRIKLRRGVIDNGFGIEIMRLTDPKNCYPMKCASVKDRDQWFRVLDMVLRGVNVDNVASLFQEVQLFGGSIMDGIDLSSRFYVERDKNQAPLWEEAVRGGVPYVVFHIVTFLTTHGLATEGLFRIPGNHATIKQMCDAYAKGTDIALTQVHDAAGVLKKYLMSLKEPVVPERLTALMIVISRDAQVSEEEKWRRLRVECERLPKPNYRVLKFLVDFLFQVAAQSHVNKMTAENLACVFGPTLLFLPKVEGIEQVSNARANTVCLRTLLEGAQEIFMAATVPAE